MLLNIETNTIYSDELIPSYTVTIPTEVNLNDEQDCVLKLQSQEGYKTNVTINSQNSFTLINNETSINYVIKINDEAITINQEVLCSSNGEEDEKTINFEISDDNANISGEYEDILTFTFDSTQLTKVTFNTNGGSETYNPKYFSEEKAIDQLPTPTKEGYDFAGWYIEGNETTGEITSEYIVTDNINLVAHWTAKTYTVTFHLNGGKWNTEFKINGNTYQIDPGMTWGEWIESEYNTDGYELYVDPQTGEEYIILPENEPEPEIEYLSLGGKVFLDNGDNGATYAFYDSGKNEITYTDLASLSDAVYYSVEGTPTKDRFYVVASDSNQADYNSDYGVNLSDSLCWGYYGITTDATTNSIGSGKTNTAKVLAITDTSTYNLANGGPYQSIWEWLNDVNTNEYGGCNDWFIGSRAEYDALRETGKAGSLFDSMYLWSDVERDSNYAYSWNTSSSLWGYRGKNNRRHVVTFRAF